MAYGALSLLTGQGGLEVALPTRWRYTYATTGHGETFAFPDFDDSAWSETAVPAQHDATREHGAIWYRVRFPRPTGGADRWLVRFQGAFQSTTVWINGKHLGQHFGYFAPFALDLTDDLADENLLTVCCECRVEWELAAKKTPIGVLNDWDCKPYPNGARGALPDDYAWQQPLGLWAPVSLISAGEAVLEYVHYAPSLRPDGSANLHVSARVTSLTDRELSGELTVGLAPANFTGEGVAPVTALVGLAPHASATVELDLHVANPALWWPWTHGEQHLYTGTAALAVEGNPSATATARFGIRTVEYKGEQVPDGPGWFINGRPFFPMGSNYICDFKLDTITYDRHRADLQLMKNANMNFVRVHVHVEPESFYQAADDLGILVMCDGVLNGCYVFGAAPEDRLFYQWAARDQVEKLVRFLYNHPSIAVWLMHNEPPYPEHCWWFGDPHRARVDRDVDMMVTLRTRELDGTRPVITASGDKDEHTYGGWYNDTWLHYLKVSPRFCTEYGAQALPNMDSPFWQHVNTDWPVAPTEPTWIYRNYQAYQWSSFGVGAPDQFPTLAEYVEASQRYQAWISRFGAERFRKLKWKPSAGIVHFMFVDGHPAITWSVVDYHRLPKQGYYALRDAFRPTHVIIDPVGEFTTDRLASVVYRPGKEVALDLWLVNDDPKASGEATLFWEANDQTGEVAVAIPADTAPAEQVATIHWTPPPDFVGEVAVRTALRQGDRVLEEHALTLVIRPESADPGQVEGTGPLLQVPAAAATSQGLRFALQNPYHPIAWKELLSVSLDGVDLSVDGLLAERDGSLQPLTRLAERPLHFTTATPVWFALQTVEPVTAGEHSLTIRARVAGYGPVSTTFPITISR